MESLAFDDRRDDASACSSNARARAPAGRIDHPILFASRIIARSKNNSASVNARLLLLNGAPRLDALSSSTAPTIMEYRCQTPRMSDVPDKRSG